MSGDGISFEERLARIYEVAIHLNKHYRDVTHVEYKEYWKNKAETNK